jgi:choline-glycine betaine transporter
VHSEKKPSKDQIREYHSTINASIFWFVIGIVVTIVLLCMGHLTAAIITFLVFLFLCLSMVLAAIDELNNEDGGDTPPDGFF